MPREWNTSFREPWNPIIKKCLDGIDLHNKLYTETKDTFHLNQADLLRVYVSRLKTWDEEEKQEPVTEIKKSDIEGLDDIRIISPWADGNDWNDTSINHKKWR